MRAERRAYVADLLAHGERIVVEGRSPSAVTDTRMIFARTLVVPPRQGEWTHDSLRFDEIATWRLGRTHDERPIIELEHPVHMRIEHVPAHHFLWWRWGNAEAPIPRSTTRFRFSSDHDPLFGAVVLGLMAASVPEGDPFRERPAGTRAERLGGSLRELTLSQEPPPLWRHRSGLERPRLKTVGQTRHPSEAAVGESPQTSMTTGRITGLRCVTSLK